jgi:hypothetical protein
MKTWISALLMVVLGVSLVGCSNMTPPREGTSRAYIGMFSGAIIGGLVGSHTAEKGGGRLGVIGLGALIGGIVGGGLGMFMDAKAYERAHPETCVTKPRQPSANSWQHASHSIASNIEKSENKPLLAKNNEKSPQPVLTTVVTNKEMPAKTNEEVIITAKTLQVPVKAPDEVVKATEKTPKALVQAPEKAQKSKAANDKVISLWHDLPSTQWFINDGQQEDLG